MSGAVQNKRQLYPKSPYPMPASLEDLTTRLYNHVFQTIDFGAIYMFEQMLWSLLPELGIRDEEGEVAATMIRDAIIKAASDPMRNISDVPYGITKEEEKAVNFEEDCFFCVYEAKNPRENDAYVDGECACCDSVAQDWREQHADVLKKHGVPPPAHTGRTTGS
jgi:hypothetical protein